MEERWQNCAGCVHKLSVDNFDVVVSEALVKAGVKYWGLRASEGARFRRQSARACAGDEATANQSVCYGLDVASKADV